jgi:hypothetical protein
MMVLQGNDIQLETADQPLPDGIKARPVITLRICDVDVEAKKSIMYDSVVFVFYCQLTTVYINVDAYELIIFYKWHV